MMFEKELTITRLACGSKIEFRLKDSEGYLFDLELDPDSLPEEDRIRLLRLSNLGKKIILTCSLVKEPKYE